MENGTCSDYDECASTSSCAANSKCTNSVGSYTCDCDDGFRGDGVVICEDINECEEIHLGNTDEGEGPCSYKCLNTPGSFECSCDTGMVGVGRKIVGRQLNEDGTIITGCTDVDECEDDLDDCHSEAVCNNTIGSFTCTCNKDYTGNGKRCSVPDKCHDVTCQANATCWLDNIAEVGYSCKCNQDFALDAQNATKCITTKKCPFGPCIDSNSDCVEDENHSDKYRIDLITLSTYLTNSIICLYHCIDVYARQVIEATERRFVTTRV